MLTGGGREYPAAVFFVSGNRDKIADARTVFGDSLRPVNLELKEIQGNEEDVAREKCKDALKIVIGGGDGIIVVEDSSLKINALGGMPGVYVKHFSQSVGPESIYRMTKDFEDKSATFVSTVAVGRHTECLFTISVQIKGTIVPPKGNFGDHKGWGTCFLPEGITKTLGEMPQPERSKYCARILALQRAADHLANFLANKPPADLHVTNTK